jgi:hypothetical protein
MGPTSEQFAIGSTVYYMIKGHEVYGSEWFGAKHPCANQSLLLLTVRPGRSYHFMTTSQTMIPFAVLFMTTRSSAVRFMVAALDRTVLILGMLYSVPSVAHRPRFGGGSQARTLQLA